MTAASPVFEIKKASFLSTIFEEEELEESTIQKTVLRLSRESFLQTSIPERKRYCFFLILGSIGSISSVTLITTAHEDQGRLGIGMLCGFIGLVCIIGFVYYRYMDKQIQEISDSDYLLLEEGELN